VHRGQRRSSERSPFRLWRCASVGRRQNWSLWAEIRSGNVVKDLGRQVFDVHDVFTGGAFHHPFSQVVAAATRMAGTSNDEVAGCGGKGDRGGRSQARLA
jgi:hypothetical protein